MRNKEIQDITATFGVHIEVESFDMKCKLGAAIIWKPQSQCPSLSVARDVYNAPLAEAARPEYLSKFSLEYGRESTTPKPRSLPDPTVR
jgi:hypothetical protein